MKIMKGELQMKIEILNQYRAVVSLDEYGKQEKIFRTKLTLTDLKEQLRNSDSIDSLIVDDAEWIDEGQVTCALAICANSNGNINVVQTFYKNAQKGHKTWRTLDEILEHDLAYVEGYGSIENKTEFAEKFRELAQKK